MAAAGLDGPQKPVYRMFDRVLIANRGEIALRILRACHELGLSTVAVHSTADRDAPHVRLAGQAICIGPGAPAQSYLNQGAILLAAELSGAQAIHPGYGFLSENPEFVARVEAAGLVFVGPSAQTVRTMGDKVAAKRAMREAGIPCVPGPDCALVDEREAQDIARVIGYPVIVKAAGGGGGRGMRIVRHESELAAAIAITRQEASQAFGNPELYVEKFLERPRHVEIQVLCDQHGNGVWLGSRDCSLQRRHQKVVEEAPALGIEQAALEAVGGRCVDASLRLGYRGVGTFEFLVEDGAFYFIEMNTRLQVEHTVTEMVTGIDLVQEQLRVAAGEPLRVRQSDVAIRGHAIECRINAEDGYTGMPSPGRIERWTVPGGNGIRIDSHVGAGSVVPRHYDSLIAKLVVHGNSRDQAVARLRNALREFDVGGVSTNLPLHRELVGDAAYRDGSFDVHFLTAWLERRRATDTAGGDCP